MIVHYLFSGHVDELLWSQYATEGTSYENNVELSYKVLDLELDFIVEKFCQFRSTRL